MCPEIWTRSRPKSRAVKLVRYDNERSAGLIRLRARYIGRGVKQIYRAKGEREISQLQQAQKDRLITLLQEFKRLQKKLKAIYRRTAYEDLEHGVLALQIAQQTIEETLDHTGLG